MKIKTITYGLTRNLGNYQLARLDVEAQIDEAEDPKESLDKLKLFVLGEIGGDFSKLYPTIPVGLTDENDNSIF